MTEAEIIAECERQFQAGGPRVCMASAGGVVPCFYTPKAAPLHACDGQTVWVRRKVATRKHGWVQQ